ncbi:MAG: tryptophan synthase subunit beta [Bacteroidales bacterium]
MTVHIDRRGFYGEFGGAWIPEMLHANVEQLARSYKKILGSARFRREFQILLADYVGRPTPLFHAARLSEAAGAMIYLKREDLCHTGSHKLNNVIGQVLLAREMEKKHIIAETGAGQHGVATATVCALMGLPCTIFMGEKDIARQHPNVMRMKMLGAEVIPAASGSRTLKDATNEAIRYWINHPKDTHYLIGSTIGPHPYPDLVARLQSVISGEIKKQLRKLENREYPDYMVACVGGGSNAAGAFYHFIDNPEVRLIGCEAAGEGTGTGKTAATISTGSAGIIHGCRTLLMQTPEGQITEAHSVSAGLDYPGIGPLHAHLYKTGRAEYLAVTDRDALHAAQELTSLEGIIPALESAHAIAALKKLKLKKDDIVVVNLSGRGDKDMDTYMESMGNL